MSSHVVSLHISEETKDKLDRLSSATDRSATAIIEDALRDYIVRQETEITAVDAAVERADQGDFVSHEAVAEWLTSWGQESERPTPTANIRKIRR